MMMASQFPPGGHPGMPQHAPPMGPGQGVHPGMHMGHQVTGPGGPHVSQAGPMMAAGMQPGMVGPQGPMSNHALSHLQPGNPMGYPQGMNPHAMSNPAMAQRIMMQRQLFNQQQQQMGHPPGSMPMAMPNGMAPGMPPNITPQQYAVAMQQQNSHPGMNPSIQMSMQHQHQLRQMQAAQQAQQAAAQAAQQQQQQQQQTLAQHTQMQQIPSQSSNQSQHAPQNPQPQPAPQAAMRPQPQVSAPPEAQPSPALSQQQGPSPQAQPQGQQPQAQPVQQQSQPQSQPGNAQQQANPQASMQQQQVMAARMRQMQQAQAQQMQQRAPNSLGSGQGILRLLNFANAINSFKAGQQQNTIEFWLGFVRRFFTEDATYRSTVRAAPKPGAQEYVKDFEVSYILLPRFFWQHFHSGTESISLGIDGAREKEAGNGYLMVEASRARLAFSFQNGTQCIWNGRLSVLYPPTDAEGCRMEMFHFHTTDWDNYIPMKIVEPLFANGSPTMQQNKSPRMSKKALNQQQRQNQQRAQQSSPTITKDQLPKCPITDLGITPDVQRWIEVNETMSYMHDIMLYSVQHPEVPPSRALIETATQYSSQANNAQQVPPGQGQKPHINLPSGPNGMVMPPGARTPNMTGGQFLQNQIPNGMSPAMANQLLPQQSPAMGHTPSPAMGNMQPPAMTHQLSQNGSINGSPSIGNGVHNTKKRRPSDIKTEGEIEVGGGRLRQSPSMRPGQGPQAKRVKS